MTNLQGSGLIPILEKRVFSEAVPLLGICLGMQLLSDRSEEGKLLVWAGFAAARYVSLLVPVRRESQ